MQRRSHCYFYVGSIVGCVEHKEAISLKQYVEEQYPLPDWTRIGSSQKVSEPVAYACPKQLHLGHKKGQAWQGPIWTLAHAANGIAHHRTLCPVI